MLYAPASTERILYGGVGIMFVLYSVHIVAMCLLLFEHLNESDNNAYDNQPPVEVALRYSEASG